MPRYQYQDPEKPVVINASAPMANPANNIGAVGTSMASGTDPLKWANQFRRTDNKIQPSIPEQVMNTVSSLAPGSPWTPPGQPFAASNQPPSLTQLAQTGVNHLQQWTQRSGNYGQITTNPDASRTLTSPYGSGRTTFGASLEPQPDMLTGDPRKKPFSFISAFR